MNVNALMKNEEEVTSGCRRWGVIKKLHPELQQVWELQLAEAAIRVGLLTGFVMILTSI